MAEQESTQQTAEAPVKEQTAEAPVKEQKPRRKINWKSIAGWTGITLGVAAIATLGILVLGRGSAD
jgi:anti-sigma-K factor RskA